MRESLGATKPKGGVKAKAAPAVLGGIPCLVWGRTTGPSGTSTRSQAEQERTRWDPKDGELCLSRLRPGETLVEGRSDSDVQIDRPTWV